MNVICPGYINTTVHKRHYYMTECSEAYKILNSIIQKEKCK